MGVGEIDRQHQVLFAAINRLLAATAQAKGRAEIGGTIASLGNYVVRHFGDEEKLMARSAYPAAAEHREQHARFLTNFAALKASFDNDGATPVLVIAVQRHVRDWLSITSSESTNSSAHSWEAGRRKAAGQLRVLGGSEQPPGAASALLEERQDARPVI